MAIIFGSEDGTELELAFENPCTWVVVRLPAEGVIGLSRIEMDLDTRGWRNVGREVNASINATPKALLGSDNIQDFLAGKRPLMSKRVERPEIRVEVAPDDAFKGIRLHNRNDGLWHQMANLSVIAGSKDGIVAEVNYCSPEASTAFYLDGGDALSGISYPAVPADELLASVKAMISLRGGTPAVDTIAIENMIVCTIVRLIDSGTLELLARDRWLPARFLLRICNLLKSEGGGSVALLAHEFIVRAVAFGKRPAFHRLRNNHPELINNSLYIEVNRLLTSAAVTAALGPLRLFGHGVFDASARPSDDALLAFCSKLQRIFAGSSAPTFLCYGALLGLLRDGALLQHDDDIDLLAMVDSEQDVWTTVRCFEEMLEAEGIRSNRTATNTRRIPFLSINAGGGGAHVDVFFGWRSESKLSIPMAKVQYGEIDLNILGSPQATNFNGHLVWLPEQPEAFLEARYGLGWRTADYLFRVREGSRPPQPVIESSAGDLV